MFTETDGTRQRRGLGRTRLPGHSELGDDDRARGGKRNEVAVAPPASGLMTPAAESSWKTPMARAAIHGRRRCHRGAQELSPSWRGTAGDASRTHDRAGKAERPPYSQLSAPISATQARSDVRDRPRGGRYFMYRPPWTVDETPTTPRSRLGGTIGDGHAAEASTASSPTNEMVRNVFHLPREHCCLHPRAGRRCGVEVRRQNTAGDDGEVQRLPVELRTLPDGQARCHSSMSAAGAPRKVCFRLPGALAVTYRRARSWRRGVVARADDWHDQAGILSFCSPS
jgi:hypothetical protein